MKHTGKFAALVGFLPLAIHARGQISSQSTSGPCSPIFNGDNNTNNCDTTPPPRRIQMADAKKAIAILQKAADSKVQFRIVGGSEEINGFSKNLAGMFQEAHWEMVPGSRTGELSVSDGFRTTHGEGIECGGRPSASFEAVKAAFQAIGHPCRTASVYRQNDPRQPAFDVYVQIGTRIIPKD